MKILETATPGFQKKLEKVCSQISSGAGIEKPVAEVIAEVRKRGDAAVCDFTEKFDRAKVTSAKLRVSEKEIADALKTLSSVKRKALRESLKCVLDFHRKTKPKSWRSRNPHGATVGEEFYPIRRVGLYVPGGQVPLVSTVVMTVALAKLAGCPEIVVCTPPQADGSVEASLLAALSICGATEVYRAGGIQAIAAMAYGTKKIKAVDKVFGPGNAYVTEAKRQLFGTVGIDLLPGPSEVLVLADKTANPTYIAADLLAQAEHGSGKEKVYFVTTHRKLIDKVGAELKKQAATLSHAKEALAIINSKALTVLARTLDEAAEVANYIAPEHLELHVADDAQKYLTKKITTAGAMLLGSDTPTVLGDFTAGPSHTLPTDRTGRFFGGLQLIDFMRRTSIVKYDRKSAAKAWPTVQAFSEMESLDAHGRSLQMRVE